MRSRSVAVPGGGFIQIRFGEILPNRVSNSPKSSYWNFAFVPAIATILR
jgi:hypothetical protein